MTQKWPLINVLKLGLDLCPIKRRSLVIGQRKCLNLGLTINQSPKMVVDLWSQNGYQFMSKKWPEKVF